MAFKLRDMDGKLGKVIARLTETNTPILLDYIKDEHQLWCEPDYLLVLNLKICVFSALYYSYQTDVGCYTLDHSKILIFSQVGDLLYEEDNSTLKVCIQNYCTVYDENILDGDNLNCVWVLDNGKFLEEKVLDTKKDTDTTGMRIPE